MGTFDDNRWLGDPRGGLRCAPRIAFWNDAAGLGDVGIRTLREGSASRRAFANNLPWRCDLMNSPTPSPTRKRPRWWSGDAVVGRGKALGFPHDRFDHRPSSAFGNGPPPDFVRDSDVVYAPHIYTGGFDGGPITRSAFEVARSEAALFDGAHVLSGEWGSDPRRAENADDGYFLMHQALQDEFRFGATLWTWRESCGEAPATRAPAMPYVGRVRGRLCQWRNEVAGCPRVQQPRLCSRRARSLDTSLYRSRIVRSVLQRRHDADRALLHPRRHTIAYVTATVRYDRTRRRWKQFHRRGDLG
jgi:hypothetical protein